MQFRLKTTVMIAALAMTAGLGAGSALAAGCPEGKGGVDVRAPVTTPASGVTDTVIASVDVAKEPAKIDGRLFRMRKLVIQPGGVVPWHSHGDRPAIIYITKGTLIEYASNCSEPITHSEGDVSTETGGTSHWWKNESNGVAELLSADLFPVKMMNTAEEHKM